MSLPPRPRPGRGWQSLPTRVAFFAAALAAPLAAAGNDPPPVVAGVGGVWRTGVWTPLEIAGAGGGEVRAWVEDPDGQFVGSPPGRVEPGSGLARVIVRPGRPTARLWIERQARGTGLEPPVFEAAIEARSLPGIAVPSTTPLLLVCGDVPAAAAAARLIAGEGPALQPVRLTSDAFGRLTTGRDLDAFDAAIVCGRELGGLSAETLAAIDAWVRGGGRLVFTAGGCAPAVAAGGGPAAGWLPGKAPRPVPLRRFAALESFSRSGGLAQRVPPDAATVPRFETPAAAGVVELVEAAAGADLPLVVRRPHGFGTLTWIGLDIDEPWCAEWPGCVRVLAALLGGPDEAVAADDVGRRPVADLAAQLRTGLERFERPAGRGPVTAVPFEVVAALGAAYVLALYPLDWWLVRRSRRPWLAWLTLPAIAASFTGAAWALGGRWGRDEPAACRTCCILDLDAASGLVRGSSWAAVRSPVNDRLLVAAAPAPAVVRGSDHDVAVSWWADRGAGFGGLDAATAHPSLAAVDYAYGDTLAELVDVPIAAASSRLFKAEWMSRTAGEPVTAALAADGRGMLRGTVTHHLPWPLERSWLLHGGWLYDAGRLEPDVAFDPAAGRGPRSLAAAVTRRRAVRDRDRAERWDWSGTDVGRILEVAAFHASAGGRGYTALESGELGRLDCSPLLAAGAAILVGHVAHEETTAWRIGIGGTGALLDPVPAADVLVRIVIPVASPPEPQP